MDVSFIVPNYNGMRTLKKCLDSLLNQNYPKNKFEIIVIDDCSKNNDLEFLKTYSKLGKIRLIENERNLKFVKTTNRGIKASKGKFVALINNDIVLEKDWLKKMMDKINTKINIGIVGCKILYPNSKKVWFGGAKVYFPGFVKHLNLGKEKEVDYVAFSAALIRKSALNGQKLDEKLIMYWEDSILCKSVKKKGFRIVYYPNAVAYHYIDEKRISANEEFFIQRNRGYYYTKYYSFSGKTVYIIADLLFFFPLFGLYRILTNPKRVYFLKEIFKARLSSVKLMMDK